MIRIFIALTLCFATVFPAMAAERWTFDKAAKAASISKGGASLIVTCAEGGVGLVYLVEKSALPAKSRNKRRVDFALSDLSNHLGVNGVDLIPSGSQVYAALAGPAADRLINSVANAPRTIIAGLGTAKGEQFDVIQSTEFSAAGSAAAIRAAVAACKG